METTTSDPNPRRDALCVGPCRVQSAEDRVSPLLHKPCHALPCSQSANQLSIFAALQFGPHVSESINAFVMGEDHDLMDADMSDEEDDDSDLDSVSWALVNGSETPFFNLNAIASPPLISTSDMLAFYQIHLQQLEQQSVTEPPQELQAHSQHGFPKLARLRLNLTALSQRYNVCVFEPDVAVLG